MGRMSRAKMNLMTTVFALLLAGGVTNFFTRGYNGPRRIGPLDFDVPANKQISDTNADSLMQGAQDYEKSGEYAKALENYAKITNWYAGTEYAEKAQEAIDTMNLVPVFRKMKRKDLIPIGSDEALRVNIKEDFNIADPGGGEGTTNNARISLYKGGRRCDINPKIIAESAVVDLESGAYTNARQLRTGYR
jgi:hypothetical protein